MTNAKIQSFPKYMKLPKKCGRFEGKNLLPGKTQKNNNKAIQNYIWHFCVIWCNHGGGLWKKVKEIEKFYVLDVDTVNSENREKV